MKYLGNRNLSEITPRQIYSILGFSIYIEECYYTPISFLNKGCPIWVNYNEDGKCDVYECDSKETTYNDLVGIIKKLLPKRKGYYCSTLNHSHTKELRIPSKNDYFLNTACFNENDVMMAVVLIEHDEVLSKEKGFECGKITNIISHSQVALKVLSEYLFSIQNDNKHRGLLLSFDATNKQDEDNAMTLGLIKIGGKYYYQFE